jgi:hypothetical protein
MGREEMAMFVGLAAYWRRALRGSYLSAAVELRLDSYPQTGTGTAANLDMVA